MALIDDEEQRWYCSKDDQVWLGKVQKWIGRITPEAERKQIERLQTVKYCKKCGNKLELEDEFCDKCGAEQKRVVTLSSL